MRSLPAYRPTGKLLRTLTAALLFLILTLIPSPAAAALGWVGNMFPTGGSSNTITDGDSFTVYVQAYKSGVTEPGGQGADISCSLLWSEVDAFGGAWLGATTTPMTYNVDIGNNDEYQATIAPPPGLYEFTAYCTDLTDGTDFYQDAGNGRLSVNADPTTPSQTRALWVEEAIIAWNSFGAATYELHYDFSGALTVPSSAGSGIPLSFDGTMGTNDYAKFPNIGGYDAWRIPASSLPFIPTILQSAAAIAAYDAGGALVDSTRLQIQGVLDDLFTYSGDLGLTYNSGVPTFRLWAPTARSVTFHHFADADPATSSTTAPMSYDPATGIWSLTGDAAWDGQYYLYEVEVFVPATGQVENNLVTDPYSVSLSQNSARSYIVDLADPGLEPAGWSTLTKPAYGNYEDISLYEIHVRDFSINDPTVAAADRGTYRAFTYDGSGTPLSDGMAHLLALEDAGLTHVHLLPAFDIATVNEDPAARSEPDPAVLATYPPDSDQQQAAVAAARADDGFNWGYDPYHYGAPEGSYATAQDGATRIVEFREMVQALNENGLRVVMDVVYNHTSADGQNPTSVLDKIVPGYYYRYTTDGTLYNSSCCPDTAVEFNMMEKLMVDTVLRWAEAYRVDGFRFDLMNLHTVDSVLAVRNAVDGLTPAAHGVDGQEIYIYGEGWTFGSAQDKGLFFANQYNMAGTGIGTFNDKIRDAAHGGYATSAPDLYRQGFINGQSYDWNGQFYAERFQGDLRYSMDRLRIALAGSLQDYTIVDQSGNPVAGINLNGTGYALDPQETVNYVSKHDNETLYDLNVFKLPAGTPMADRVRVQNLGLSLVGFSQGIPFFHLGSDMLRSKSLDRNSYDSGDWFNAVDFTYTDNNFGVGLPPAWDNDTRWPIMGPLLADGTLQPTNGDILSSVAHLQEVLEIRASSPLFRLTDPAEIAARIAFHNTGPAQQDGLLVMTLSDAVGVDLDPANELVVVLINANTTAQNFTLGALTGLPATLHPVQQSSADPVVQTASFDSATGEFTVPARTAAVFVSAAAPASASDIDYVGAMFPAGGISSQVLEGDPGGHTVYVQVYEPGVTGSNNGSTGAAIDCLLHWGRYGEPWSDLPMSFNAAFSGNANNDEYFATIPTAALAPGTYGYTAYCTDDGGTSKKWRDDDYFSGVYDGGDGLLTVVPAPEPPPGTAFVHLFEWRWTDIAQECAFLAEKGYSAVQVSPPSEHLPPAVYAPDYPWWVRYQPVSYDLAQSRSGTAAEFAAMVSACAAEGVDIYVDAVINHMTGEAAGGTGTNGTPFGHYDYPSSPGQYDGSDFHYCGTNLGDGDAVNDHNINTFAERYETQNCELLNLADLNTGDPTVRAEIRTYLQGLLDLGVAGFRIDAGKHIPSHDIAAILTGLSGDYYVFQEVIDLGGEEVRAFEYLPNGDVTEFNYSQIMAAAFTDNPGAGCTGPDVTLLNGLESGLLTGDGAVIFTDNHDNQRGHGPGGGCIVDHRDGAVYDLANVFMLAYPYGYPKVMSSYAWDGVNDNAGPPGAGGVTSPVYSGGEPLGCNGSEWICEHRRTAIANMVGFRAATAGAPVVHWWDNGGDQLAFGRGALGYVAINRGGAQLTRTFQTGLPAGFYCDVTRYDADGTACYLPGTATPAPAADLVVVDAAGQIADQSVAALAALAIHVDARVDVSAGDGAGSYGAAWHLPGGPRLGAQATYAATWITDNSDAGDDGVVQSGTWTVAGGGAVEVTVTGADGYVSGWIDWDGSGAYGDAAGEELFTNELVEAGQTRTVSFSIPAGTSLSQSLSARFRVYDAPQSRAAAAPTGGAGPGEVEDYVWTSTPTAVTAGSVVADTGRSPAPLLALLLLALLSVGAIAGRRAARPR